VGVLEKQEESITEYPTPDQAKLLRSKCSSDGGSDGEKEGLTRIPELLLSPRSEEFRTTFYETHLGLELTQSDLP